MNRETIFPASLPKRVIDSTFPARIALACAFPPREGYRGADQKIQIPVNNHDNNSARFLKAKA